MDIVNCVFIDYCHAKEGGHAYSSAALKRHSPLWTKPHLKADLIYGLRILLSIIDKANTGLLSKEKSEKRAKEIPLCHGWKMNELFAVAVLRGLIVPWEFLLNPKISGTLCQRVRKQFFDGNSEMTNSRIKKPVERVAESIGLDMLGAEHAVEDMLPKSPWISDTAGHDIFSFQQSFTWMNAYSNRGEEEMVHEVFYGGHTHDRTEEMDRQALMYMKRGDNNNVYHQWWKPSPNRHDCLIHFVNKCVESALKAIHFDDFFGYRSNYPIAVVPTRLLYPFTRQRGLQNTGVTEKEESEKHWSVYIREKSIESTLIRFPLIIYDRKVWKWPWQEETNPRASKALIWKEKMYGTWWSWR
jgi:hypothetical protein